MRKELRTAGICCHLDLELPGSYYETTGAAGCCIIGLQQFSKYHFFACTTYTRKSFMLGRKQGHPLQIQDVACAVKKYPLYVFGELHCAVADRQP